MNETKEVIQALESLANVFADNPNLIMVLFLLVGILALRTLNRMSEKWDDLLVRSLNIQERLIARDEKQDERINTIAERSNSTLTDTNAINAKRGEQQLEFASVMSKLADKITALDNGHQKTAETLANAIKSTRAEYDIGADTRVKGLTDMIGSNQTAIEQRFTSIEDRLGKLEAKLDTLLDLTRQLIHNDDTKELKPVNQPKENDHE